MLVLIKHSFYCTSIAVERVSKTAFKTHIYNNIFQLIKRNETSFFQITLKSWFLKNFKNYM